MALKIFTGRHCGNSLICQGPIFIAEIPSRVRISCKWMKKFLVKRASSHYFLWLSFRFPFTLSSVVTWPGCQRKHFYFISGYPATSCCEIWWVSREKGHTCMVFTLPPWSQREPPSIFKAYSLQIPFFSGHYALIDKSPRLILTYFS